MKKINRILCAAAIAAIVTLSGRTAVASPKGDEQRPVTVTSSQTDLNTVHGQPMLGKATPDRVAVSGHSESDTLRMIKNCPLSPKAKEDSAACKTCCVKTTCCTVAMK